MNDGLEVSTSASYGELSDGLSAAILQAEAMVFVMSDEGFEQWNESIKANYIWSLQRKIEEVRALFAAMQRVK